MTLRLPQPQTLLLLLLLTLVGCGSEKSDREKNITSTTEGSYTLPKTTSNQDAPNRIETPSSEKASTSEFGQPMLERDRLVEEAEQKLSAGNIAEAERLLKTALLRNPDDAEVIFRLATTIAMTGRIADALDYMEAIPTDHPDAGLPALGQTADWCFQLKRYDEAEKKYQQILSIIPDAAEALRKLAYLYNRQGRRQEAAEHIQRLCELGNVLQDELHALIQISDAMYDPIDTESEYPPDAQSSDNGLSRDENRPYWPIGLLAQARIDFSNQSYQEAAEKLKRSLNQGSTNEATIAFLGRASAEAQDEEGLKLWLSNQSKETERYADHWAALGLVLLQENRIRESGRAFLEALSRDPTDFRSISRLRSILEATDDQESSAKIEERFQVLKSITDENNRIVDSLSSDPSAMLRMASQMETIDRNVEAAIWRLLAAFRQNLPKSEMLKLQTELQNVLKSGKKFPNLEARLCGIEIESFPLPSIDRLAPSFGRISPSTAIPGSAVITAPAFENVAQSVGLQHAYRIASEAQDSGFSVYQSVGGAVVVLDYDCDGNQDLYFAQGAADPPRFAANFGNQLYRTTDRSMRNIAEKSETDLRQYSLGATAGDWNQDGLPDLVVSNIGRNTLFINNGDGTFDQRRIDNRDDKTLMSTSLAIADLNGDHLPDLFEVNYLHDKELPKRPKRNAAGEVIETLMPKDFQPGFDRIITQSSDGKLTYHELNEKPNDAKSGLGIVISDFDHQPGNEIFVGNDVGANQWWKKEQASERWKDTAMLRGCAYGFSGAKTASMGIASGDFDRNGWIDLHITNFQGESVSHYLNENGFFRDLNLQYSLANPSENVLGFGAQSLDYDLDGDLDLAVVNGHIENSVATREQYKQPAQLFVNQGDQFFLTDVSDPSGYWPAFHVGRGLARLDWNQDGKPDLVVTHQAEPSALLINRTQTNNQWLQINLVGTDSERDAIGTRIEVDLGDLQLTEWITAGDGFFGHNQASAFFGLGEETKIQKIVIHWPTGKTQTLQNPCEANTKILVIENQEQFFRWQ